jgi:hypothetical protein
MSLSTTGDPDVDRATVATLISALHQIDRAYIARNPETPCVYESGVVYEREPFGGGFWMDVGRVLARGSADCEDLACYRASWLNVRGVDRFATPVILTFDDSERTGIVHFHVVVRRGNGTIEDPSKALGMPGDA